LTTLHKIFRSNALQEGSLADCSVVAEKHRRKARDMPRASRSDRSGRSCRHLVDKR
jgi:hypothetical protein